jgi:glycosyltransferase involved in cell wall biosynthesis
MPPMERPLHVGLNLVFLEPDSGGTGTYARELIRGIHALEPDTRITAWVGTGAPDLDWPVEWVRLPFRSSGSPVHVPVELLWLGLDARRRGVDVVHGLAYATPVIAPGVATVVTILDLTWRHHPAAATWLARRMFGLLTPVCGRSADRIVSISETGKADLVDTMNFPAHKIDVTPLGVADGARVEPRDERAVRNELGLGGAPILLSVGQLSRHKNYEVLVDALPELGDAVAVICGRHTEYADELKARAVALGVADRLVLPGFTEDATVEALFAMADAFVMTSRFEGFGLPVLEAMRRGVPVACSNASALPETAGNAAALFDPSSPAELLVAIGRLREDRDGWVARGRERATEFTWEATARATLASYRRAIGAR